MGFAFSKLYNGCFAKEEFKILFLGLDHAGKTSVIYKLKYGEIIDAIQTQGYNMETIAYKNVQFTVWDLSTRMKTIVPWKPYLQDSQAIVFVVDSSDPDRIQEAREQLQDALNSDEIQDSAAVLILANKQDQAKMSLDQIKELLGLSTLKRSWLIQGTCVMTGDGIYEGFDWLMKTLKSD